MNKNIILLLFTVYCSLSIVSAQSQHTVDSLENELKVHRQDTVAATILLKLSNYYLNTNLDTAAYFGNRSLALSEQIGYKKGISNAYQSLGWITHQKGDYLAAIELNKKALAIKEAMNDKKGIAAIYNNMGSTYKRLGNYPEALKCYFLSLKIDEELASKKGIAQTLNNIGNLYMDQDNYHDALQNYSACLTIMEEIKYKKGIAAIYNNIGILYDKQGNFPEALKNYYSSLKVAEESGDKRTIAANYSNIAIINMKQGNYVNALKDNFIAIKTAEELGSKKSIAICFNNIGKIYIKQKKYSEAAEYLNKSLSIAKTLGSLELIKDSYNILTEMDSTQGNYKGAFAYYKLFIASRDSLINIETTKKTVAMQMNYYFEKKQDSIKAEQGIINAIAKKEIQKQKFVRNGFVGGFAVMMLFAIVFFTQRNRISKARKRSDELLLNILPEEVADELKEKGTADAKHFDEVTVMFTDFKGFTQISERLSPAELVNEIHECFKAFDHIIAKHNIEKIKTIGDAYMCAGGLPVSNNTHADDVVNGALEIQKFMVDHLQRRRNEGKEIFEIRIGIHTGPVVAGIVGVKKFAYDIWGDTVNIASRMESSGEVGKVNISGRTFELVRDKFNCIHRGKIQAKNKGEIDMYFVS